MYIFYTYIKLVTIQSVKESTFSYVEDLLSHKKSWLEGKLYENKFILFWKICFESSVICRSHKVGGGPVTNFHHFEYNSWLCLKEHSIHIMTVSSSLLFSIGKGQLISKCPFGVIVWTKKPTKNLTISALEFEKWSNHKIKSTL